MENYGATFRKIRKSKQFVLKELADERCSVSLLAQFEKNQTNISYDRFLRLLKKVEVSLAEFEAIHGADTPSFVETQFRLFSEIMNTTKTKEEIPPNLAKLSQIHRKLITHNQHFPSLRGKHYALYMEMILYSWQQLLLQGSLNLRTIQPQLTTILAPALSYLSTVDNWGLYELHLFRLLALAIEPTLLWRFTQQSLKKAAKLAKIEDNETLYYKGLATVFSVFLSLHEFEFAKKVLHLWQENLAISPCLEFALALPFYKGWFYAAAGEAQKATSFYQETIDFYEQIGQKKTANEFRSLQKNITRALDQNHLMVFVHL